MISRENLGSHFPLRKLGDIAVFLDHMRRPVKESERLPGPYPYLGANGLQGYIDGYLFDEPLVLLAEDGGHFDNPERGIAYRVSGKAWVNNHAHVLRPGPEADWAYLARVLENYDVRPFISGTTRGKLTKGQAENIIVPLPPLAEQRRIAAILDQADALRAKRRAALVQLDEMAQATFVEMFGDPAAPKSDCPTVPLSDVAKLINGDRSSNYPSGEDVVREGILFLNTKNISGPDIELSRCDYITEAKFRSLSQGKLQRHDLVITLRGSYGQCAEFDCSEDTGFINAQMMIIRSSARTRPKFLREFIAHPSTQALLKRDSSGSAVPQLTGRQVGELLVPVPPIDRQECFSRKVLSARKLQAKAARHLSELDALFASLQHRAFNGYL